MAPSVNGLSLGGIHFRRLHIFLLGVLFFANSRRVKAMMPFAGVYKLFLPQGSSPRRQGTRVRSGSVGKEFGLKAAPVPLPSGYIPDGVTRDLLITWAESDNQMGMPPGARVQMEQCSGVIEAKIAHPSRRQSIARARRAFASNVVKHQMARTNKRRSMQNSGASDATSLLFVQWNTELFVPSPWEILQSVIPANGSKPDVNAVDAVFITLQENLKMRRHQYKSFIASLVSGLNALSQRKDWSVESSSHTQLVNSIGTKFPRLGPWANTQAVIMLGRSHIPPGSISHCQWAWKFRQKGFVGIAATIGSEHVRVLVLGVHVITTTENQSRFLDKLLRQASNRCVPRGHSRLGLDYFAGGVLMVGDMNSRLSQRTTDALMEKAASMPMFSELKEVVPQTGQSVQQAQLLQMLNAPLRTKEMKYFPLLYAVDTLGGSPPERPGSDLILPLLRFNFDSISACYAGLVSFKWRKGCQVKASDTQPEVTQKCLDTVSTRRAGGMGFLDRLIIRRPPTGRACGEARCSFQQTDSFLVFSGQLRNFRGDHIPQVYVVQIYWTTGSVRKAKSAPAV